LIWVRLIKQIAPELIIAQNNDPILLTNAHIAISYSDLACEISQAWRSTA